MFLCSWPPLYTLDRSFTFFISQLCSSHTLSRWPTLPRLWPTDTSLHHTSYSTRGSSFFIIFFFLLIWPSYFPRWISFSKFLVSPTSRASGTLSYLSSHLSCIFHLSLSIVYLSHLSTAVILVWTNRTHLSLDQLSLNVLPSHHHFTARPFKTVVCPCSFPFISEHIAVRLSTNCSQISCWTAHLLATGHFLITKPNDLISILIWLNSAVLEAVTVLSSYIISFRRFICYYIHVFFSVLLLSIPHSLF